MQDIFDAVQADWVNNVMALLAGMVAVYVLFATWCFVKRALLGGGGDGSSLTAEEKEYLRNYDPRDADYNK